MTRLLNGLDEHMTRLLNGIDERMKYMDHMSMDQFETLTNKLGQLKLGVGSPQMIDISPSNEPEDARSPEPVKDGQIPMTGRVQAVIERLACCADESQKTLFNDEADNLIKDLDEIFELLKDQKQSADDADSLADYLREAKRMQRIVTASPTVVVNGEGAFATTLFVNLAEMCLIVGKSKRKLTKRYNRTQIVRSFQCSAGRVTVYTRRGQLMLKGTRQSDNDPIQIFRGSLTLCTNGPIKAYFSISFVQEMYAGHSLTAGPILSVSHVLPEDAEVFRVIEDGNLQDLELLLDERKAMFSTRDPDGRCLLHVILPRVYGVEIS